MARAFTGAGSSLLDILGTKKAFEDDYSSLVFGSSTYFIKGSAKDMAEEIIWAVKDGGVDGIIFSFFNWASMLEYFCVEGLPILQEAGIREAVDIFST